MDPIGDQEEAAAPQALSHDHHRPAHHGDWPHPAHASAPEQPGAPLSTPLAPEGPSDEAQAALLSSGGTVLSGGQPAGVVHDQQPEQQLGAAPEVATHPGAPQAPAEGSYEALAAFSGPVGTEMPGAGLHNDAQDQQPTHNPGHHLQSAPAHPELDSDQQAADAPAAEFPAHSTESALPFHPEQSLQEAQHAADENSIHDADGKAGSAQGTKSALPFHPEHSRQEAQHAANEKSIHEADGKAGSAQGTGSALTFHPEHSLQEAQHAGDEKSIHEADGKAGIAQGMHTEMPDEEMTEAAQTPETGTVHVQFGGHSFDNHSPTRQGVTEAQQGPPQQTRQPQPTPAVRTLDDIMSQFEGVPQPPVQAFSSPTARQEPCPSVSGSPRPAQVHQTFAIGHGGPDGHVHAAEAEQDQDMGDAVEAETPVQPMAETPSETLLQGKGSAKGGAARRQEIKPETDAGSLVWAKTKGYPWWPAQVLAIDDPWIPPDMEIPRRGAVPVRFFGTYNFTWIESQRNLLAFGQGCQDDLPSKGNTKVFQDGLGEARRYLDTGETPAGFSTMPVSPEAAPEEASAKAGKRPGSAKAREGGPGGPGISKDAGKLAAARRKEAEKAAAARAGALQRRQRALKKLGLVPPRGSPYAEEPCLDVARTWFAQALVEESARQQRVQEQQRQLEERQKLQQAMFQGQLAAQMLHQQQLLQRAAAQQGGQEAAPGAWRPAPGFANSTAASAAPQPQQQVPEQYQAPGYGRK